MIDLTCGTMKRNCRNYNANNYNDSEAYGKVFPVHFPPRVVDSSDLTK